MGNSAERIPVKDLGDVIYYKQVKEYTDVEFETSKDLNREIKVGRIVVLEKNAAFRGSDVVPGHTVNKPVDMTELKAAIREAMPNSSIDIKGAIKELAPLIADILRQELAKMPMQQGGYVSAASVSSGPVQFKDVSYVPTVSTEGMVSSIEAKETETSGDAAQNALSVLKNMGKYGKD